MEDNGRLLPSYLRFVRGVIDSSDLPLNVSRELLQSSRVVDHIRVNAVKKVLRLLADLAANEPEKYAAFWAEFGGALKEGMADDFHNRDEIARLLRFHSTKSGGDAADVSLSDYTGRMAEGQQHIYYLVAPSLATAAASPHLEAFKSQGRGGAAARRGRRQLGGQQPARVRRHAAGVGGAGRGRRRVADRDRAGRGRGGREGAGGRRASPT